jgi:hypothetical protein
MGTIAYLQVQARMIPFIKDDLDTLAKANCIYLQVTS